MRLAVTFCFVCAAILAPVVANADAPLHLTAAQKAMVAKYNIAPEDEAALFGGSGKPAAVEKPAAAAGGTAAAKDPAAGAKSAGKLCDGGWTFLIRSDFKDADTLGCNPTSTAQASGAKFSFLNDQVSNNTLLSASGTAAAVFTQVPTIDGGDEPQPFYYSFGAYAHADLAFNSSAALVKKNANTLALGGVAELGYFNLFGGDQYFRLSGGDVHDANAGTDVGNLAFEWVPAYGRFGIHEGGQLVPGIESFFSPEVAVRYDSAIGPHQAVAFSGGSQALRIGPEFTWLLNGQPRTLFQALNVKLVYDLDYETFSSRFVPWFAATASYNLNSAGNVAITAEYDNGTDPLSGAAKNQVTVGLTGKL